MYKDAGDLGGLLLDSTTDLGGGAGVFTGGGYRTLQVVDASGATLSNFEATGVTNEALLETSLPAGLVFHCKEIQAVTVTAGVIYLIR